ncbi:DUF2236 domain-containing protein [Winogradskyella sp. DF17]|uniref:DUF2236 domain-containing protein n=1 Tax=Winogradskyella pelagia TaxID=2819984 RepID=A0ABS3T4J6_9FLAO|nr:oxygenase MpaB family protein [Winogradskyella sp. DF17]MBO3117665.1 DUF2236 domain-containing protein [Winogradskyella sp. DF17]
MEPFVHHNSIVRKIWGNSDTILVVFAGAAAEFALNKAVDWLYFTGKLPKDPLGRLFSTVNYAKAIVFADKAEAVNAIDTITAIHKNVENKRGSTIPDWAYKDVLYMLIDYSIRAYELLEEPLKNRDKEEVLSIFRDVGLRMGLEDLPKDYCAFEKAREQHLKDNLLNSNFTKDLYQQYNKHLGRMRYLLLIETQRLVLPKAIKPLLWKRHYSFISPAIYLYKGLRTIKLDGLLKAIILPKAYKADIERLNYSKY